MMNYTIRSGLHVHPVHVSRMEEDGRVVQERSCAIVPQVYD